MKGLKFDIGKKKLEVTTEFPNLVADKATRKYKLGQKRNKPKYQDNGDDKPNKKVSKFEIDFYANAYNQESESSQ